MTYKLPLPAPRDDLYSLVTVAGLSLFLSVELVYFLFSDPPSFYMPSVDAFGGTAIGRDFLNTWMGGRSALADGPSAWFDFRVYNNLLSELVGVTESYSRGRIRHTSCCSSGHSGSCPTCWHSLCGPLSAWPFSVYAASRGGVERKHLLFIAVAPAATINAIIGQNGFFAAAL